MFVVVLVLGESIIPAWLSFAGDVGGWGRRMKRAARDAVVVGDRARA